MTAINILRKAVAPATLWLGIASVIAGSAAAYSHGNFMFLPALACLIFCVCAQIFSNITHRYYDDKHRLGENAADGMYYCEDLDKPVSYVLKEGMRVTGIIAATAGLMILAFAGWWVLIIGVIIAIFVLIANVGPCPLSRTAFYPLITFFMFGPVAVIGTCIVQSEASSQNMLSWWDLEPAVVMSVIIGLMAMNSHLIFGTFHHADNTQSSRTTFFDRYGKRGYLVCITISTLIYGATGVFAPLLLKLFDMPWIYIPIPVLSVVFSYYTVKLTLKPETCHKAWHYSLLNIMAYAILSFIVFCIIGYPEGYLDAAPSNF